MNRKPKFSRGENTLKVIRNNKYRKCHYITVIHGTPSLEYYVYF